MQTFRMPMLRDSHTHPLLYAAFLDAIDLEQNATAGRDAALERIRERARAAAEPWTIAHGWNNGRFSLAKEDFDDLPPVVVFNLSLHGLIVNDAGRRLLGRTAPSVVERLDDQHWIERNLRTVLNGFVKDGASPENLRRFFEQLLGEHGVWHAEEMLLVDEHEIRLFDEAGLAERTRFWAAPEQFEALPAPLQERIHGIKLFTDGALSARTAALHRPYRASAETGMLIYEREALQALIGRYLAIGKPLAIHAIGDRAIDQVVLAVDVARASRSDEIRIEHAQFLSETTARRARSLGIRLCMQPNFSDDSVHYADRLPDGYAERNNPFRMLIDEIGYVPGVDLVFGSDGMPHGIREAVRQSFFPRYAGQRLTREEFVAGYCISDTRCGHIDVRLESDGRRVDASIALPTSRTPR